MTRYDEKSERQPSFEHTIALTGSARATCYCLCFYSIDTISNHPSTEMMWGVQIGWRNARYRSRLVWWIVREPPLSGITGPKPNWGLDFCSYLKIRSTSCPVVGEKWAENKVKTPFCLLLILIPVFMQNDVNKRRARMFPISLQPLIPNLGVYPLFLLIFIFHTGIEMSGNKFAERVFIANFILYLVK